MNYLCQYEPPKNKHCLEQKIIDDAILANILEDKLIFDWIKSNSFDLICWSYTIITFQQTLKIKYILYLHRKCQFYFPVFFSHWVFFFIEKSSFGLCNIMIFVAQKTGPKAIFIETFLISYRYMEIYLNFIVFWLCIKKFKHTNGRLCSKFALVKPYFNVLN